MLEEFEDDGEKRFWEFQSTEEFEKIGSVKASVERSLFFILFVVFVSTAEIEFEISILRLEFDSETWRQSQNGV